MGLINSTFSMFIWILAVLLFLVGCSTYIHKPIKFDWNASESAPRDYPMRIISGSLYTKGDYFQSIPNGGSIYFGWGRGWSSDIVGPDLKPLPSALAITFYSFTEDQFYSDRFELPYDKILTSFKQGYFSPKEHKNITFHTIIVGVAPGGVVSVWLEGIDKTVEIFSGVAKKIKNDWGLINNNPEIKKDHYISAIIKDAVENEKVKEQIRKKEIPTQQWRKYHDSVYKWVPRFTGLELRDNWIQNIKYYNGEEGYLNYPMTEEEANKPRGIPKEFDFVWKYDKDTNYSYELYFDEEEMFDVFKKYGSKNDPLELEINIVREDKQMKLSVALKNYVQDKGVYLKKFRLETYGAD